MFANKVLAHNCRPGSQSPVTSISKVFDNYTTESPKETRSYATRQRRQENFCTARWTQTTCIVWWPTLPRELSRQRWSSHSACENGQAESYTTSRLLRRLVLYVLNMPWNEPVTSDCWHITVGHRPGCPCSIVLNVSMVVVTFVVMNIKINIAFCFRPNKNQTWFLVSWPIRPCIPRLVEFLWHW